MIKKIFVLFSVLMHLYIICYVPFFIHQCVSVSMHLTSCLCLYVSGIVSQRFRRPCFFLSTLSVSANVSLSLCFCQCFSVSMFLPMSLCLHSMFLYVSVCRKRKVGMSGLAAGLPSFLPSFWHISLKAVNYERKDLKTLFLWYIN